MTESEKKFGVVRFVSEDFGFIELPGTNDPEVFFNERTKITYPHNMSSRIKVGDEVSFTSRPGFGDRLERAIEVEVLAKLGTIFPKPVVAKKKEIPIQEAINGNVRSGMIKFYDIKKGFGFLIPDKSGPDIFFHIYGVNKSIPGYGESLLLEGQRVIFEVRPNDRGLEAWNVKVQL